MEVLCFSEHMHRTCENDLNNNYVESIVLSEILFIKRTCKCIIEGKKASIIVEKNVREHFPCLNALH